MCASASPVAVRERAPAKAPPSSHARRVLSRNSVAIGVLSSASSEHMSQGNVWKKMNADRCGHFHDVGCIRRHQRKHRLAHVRGAFFPTVVSRSRLGVVRGSRPLATFKASNAQGQGVHSLRAACTRPNLVESCRTSFRLFSHSFLCQSLAHVVAEVFF